MAKIFSIGRGGDCDIVISSPYLSSKHITIELLDPVNLIFRIADQNSTNGTFVNGDRIEQAEISPSDRINLGEYYLKPADYMLKVTGKNSPIVASPTMAGGATKPFFLIALLLGFLIGGGLVALLSASENLFFISAQLFALLIIFCGFTYVLLQLRQKASAISYEKELHQIKVDRLRFDVEQQEKQRQLKGLNDQYAWNGYRKFEVVKKQIECADISSFYLRAHDQREIPSFHPGQYLTFNINIPGIKKPAVRCYSLSDCSDDNFYRVSIKRQIAPKKEPSAEPGLVSNYFHDSVSEGDIVDAKMPSGGFYLDVNKPRPVVLLAGGIGITPMLSMLNGLVKQRTQHDVWLFYGVRNGAELIHAKHLMSVAEEHNNVHLIFCFSQPGEREVKGTDYHVHGRVDIGLLKDQLPSNNFDFYLCGPGPFMQSLIGDLNDWGIPSDNIHSEAFGPSSVIKRATPIAGDETPKQASHQVFFAKSNKTVSWNGDVSLLELAEANDVTLDSGCRAGNCGTCLTALREGQVDYNVEHDADIEKGSCLACICTPASDLIVDA